MFAIKKVQEKGFDKIILTDTHTSSSVEIIPSCGAMLHAFTVHDEKANINLIDSYKNKKEFDSHAEEEGFKGLKLSPFPCRIPNAVYNFNNKQYRLGRFLRNGSALHGLLYNQSFKIVEEEINEDCASILLSYEYKADEAGYPFTYDCNIKYTLGKNNALSIITTIVNTGSLSLPIADGWHPYFTFGNTVNDLELQFQSEEMLEFVNLIPSGKILPYKGFIKSALIGETELDNSFVLDFSKAQPMCILWDPISKWQLEIYPDKNYPYLQIYIPPHRKSISIENLSAPPDSFNNGIGLITLEGGKEVSFTTKFVVCKK